MSYHHVVSLVSKREPWNLGKAPGPWVNSVGGECNGMHACNFGSDEPFYHRLHHRFISPHCRLRIGVPHLFPEFPLFPLRILYALFPHSSSFTPAFFPLNVFRWSHGEVDWWARVIRGRRSLGAATPLHHGSRWQKVTISAFFAILEDQGTAHKEQNYLESWTTSVS